MYGFLKHPVFAKAEEVLARLNMPELGRQQMPKFWRRPSALSVILRELLMPFTVVYYAVFLWKQKNTSARKLSVPVWCVGNATAGGGGKTPFALWLARNAIDEGYKPAFLSRGFGGIRRKEAVLVNTDQHGVQDVGDEPLLLARVAPCYVCADRFAAGKKAIADGANLLIMDDGLQHFALHKDKSFLMVDGQTGYGNHGVIPGGPLREPPHKIYPRVHAVIQVGENKSNWQKKYPLPADKRLFPARLLPDSETLAALGEKRYQPFLAFAGIALPDKFFTTLKEAGLNVVEAIPFPDHYLFSEFELKDLAKRAESKNAHLITTEKDAVRLPAHWREKVSVLPVSLEVPDAQGLKNILYGPI